MLKVVILVKQIDMNPHCPIGPLTEQGLPVGIVFTQVLDDEQNVPGGQTPVP
jgi:predicted RNA-binding protein